MKNFFKTFGAALLAFFVGTVLMWFVLFSIIGGIAASSTTASVCSFGCRPRGGFSFRNSRFSG